MSRFLLVSLPIYELFGVFLVKRTNNTTPARWTRTNPENRATTFNGSTTIKLSANPAPVNNSLTASPRFTSRAIRAAALAPRYLNTLLAKIVPGIREINPPISNEYALIQPAANTAATHSNSKKISWKTATLYMGGAFIVDMSVTGRQKLSCFWHPFPV